MIMKGHVVITFNIHRNGAITDIEVKKPSHIESFNHAAVNALMSSNPTQPLPPNIHPSRPSSPSRSSITRTLQISVEAMSLPTRPQQLGLLILLGAAVFLAFFRM